MNRFLMAAGLSAAALSISAPASATVFFGFGQGQDVTDLSGYTLFNAFEIDSGITGSGYQIKSPPSDGNGAVIPTSNPTGTNYLSVLGGGTANIALPSNTAKFAFDWGSLDSYNRLRIFGIGGAFGAGGSGDIIPGTTFANAANGDQFSTGTNGVLFVFGTAGERFTGLELTSGANSFEIDNLVVGVPEPAMWAMMIVGFGLVGGAMRRRIARAKVSYA